MKKPFNGADTTRIEFDQECAKIIDALLDNVSLSAASLELGNSLDALFSGGEAGQRTLSHDALALLLEIFGKAAFTRAARPSAARARAQVTAAHQSFYKED